MRKLIVAFVAAITFIQAQAQPDVQAPSPEAVSEGRMLYRLLWISEFGRSEFYNLFGDDGMRKFGFRQISYLNGEGQFVNFYYDVEGAAAQGDVAEAATDAEYRVITRIYFDNPFEPKSDETGISPTLTDTLDSAPTPEELSLIKMREDVNRRMSHDEEHIFEADDNAMYKWFPMIYGGRRNVFVISYTGPITNFLTFGGDYRLTYDAEGRLVQWRKLHDTYIDAELPDSSLSVVDRIRSLVVSLRPAWQITPTDVFALLIYADVSEYKRQYAMGDIVFAPEWNREREEFVISTLREFSNQQD